jgi:nucleoside-diphosphate-sugar epimerase
MTSALVGNTGFVGGNLDRQLNFTHRYHSKNIREIAGQEFETLYCAGVSAAKWRANQAPEEDLLGIAPLLVALEQVKVERFILISTIDVYAEPLGVTEKTPINAFKLHPYGTHRRLIELFVQERYPVHHIIRLPGLFGEGIKKNIIFDLLHNNQVDKIHSDGQFQFYDLSNLSRDIKIVIDQGLPIVNFAVEPTSVREVAQFSFGRDFTNRPVEITPARYDMRTIYGKCFGGPDDYLQDKQEVLDRLLRFVSSEREKNP